MLQIGAGKGRGRVIGGQVSVVPATAGRDLRLRLGLGPQESLRISFLPGPGDVAGTFVHWQAGKADPRESVIAYSLMFYDLARQLDAACQVIALHPVEAAQALADPARFRFERVVQPPVHGPISWRYGHHLMARQMVARVGRFAPHVVVVSSHFSAAAWAPLGRGRKLVLSMHNAFWPMGRPRQDLRGRLRRAVLAWQARAVDGAICTSQECARQLAALTGNRLQGEVEVPQILHRHRVESRSRIRKLLFLGRIEEPKGVFLLLEAFARLAPRHPELSLTFAGYGGAEAALKARVAALGLEARVALPGRLDGQGVHAAIAGSDLVICPTLTRFNEGLALVGFEAAAHGIPALLSDCVPAADLLGESCRVFRADDGAALEAGLETLVSDPAAYQACCAATATVRAQGQDRALSWGSGLFRAMMRL